jgi:hypothetical protein
MVLPRLHTERIWFKDPHGRTILLRGVNLGGDCKVPFQPNEATYIPTDFSKHRDVSFIGRPFPLDQAPQHFARLKAWGFNCLRLLTTWEAVEHKGPGIIDRDYVNYYGKLVEMARDHGLYVFVDFHQDVWSRMTGGDGAPGWLFEKVGIDYTKLSEANAALVMQHKYNFNDPRPRQEDNYPTMCWGQNYRFAGNAIMWTLFFGGRDFAPDVKIEGINVQDFMQKHYHGCLTEIAKRVKDLPNVLGFDSLNEPHSGWIGVPMDDAHLITRPADPAWPGYAWSPITALYASHGRNMKIPFMELSLLRGGFVPKKLVDANPKKVSIWLPGKTDPFGQAWKLTEDSFTILNNDYFRKVGDRIVDFDRDYMLPFVNSVAETIRKINPDWLVFAEKDATKAMFDANFPPNTPPKMVNATHWYDGAINGTKKVMYPFTIDIVTQKPVFGEKGMQQAYERALGAIKNASAAINNGEGVPTLMGEFGIPFDLNQGQAYKKYAAGRRSEKIWRDHIRALNLMYNVMDKLLISSTQWNYTASNRNDGRIGDGWNQEDFSIFSEDQRANPADPNSGGRALTAFLRPFARCVQGIPESMSFDYRTGQFRLNFEADTSIPQPTEIFVPLFQYPNGYHIIAEGTRIAEDPTNQLVYLTAEKDAEIRVIIQRK